MASSGASELSAKAKVLVLGTYHMANPGLDYVKAKIRATLSVERQSEVQLLMSRLLRYEPTQIAVEVLPGSRMNERYASYREGRISLSADEVEQIGFRLGKMLGHSRLYAVDHPGDMDFEGLKAFAEEHRELWFLEKLERVRKDIAEKTEEIDRRFTVAQLLAIHNSTESLAFSHSIYIDMLRLSSEDSYPGVDVVAGWYRRNMAIYANIRRMIGSPQDRVLVIIGAGHAKLLGDFVAEADDLDLVDPLDYLPDVPGFRWS